MESIEGKHYRWEKYKGKDILMIDYRGFKGVEYKLKIEEATDYILCCGIKDMLIIIDVFAVLALVL